MSDQNAQGQQMPEPADLVKDAEEWGRAWSWEVLTAIRDRSGKNADGSPGHIMDQYKPRLTKRTLELLGAGYSEDEALKWIQAAMAASSEAMMTYALGREREEARALEILKQGTPIVPHDTDKPS